MNQDKIENQKSILEDVDAVIENAYREHSEFNEEFNGTDALCLKSFQSDSEYLFEKSAVLFRMDRETYYEELSVWENNLSTQKHKDIIEHLKSEGCLPIFRELVLTIKRKKIAPFIGAGLSSSLGFPLWGKALSEIYSRVYTRKNNDFEKLLAEYKYLEAAEILYNKNKRGFTSYVSDNFLIDPNSPLKDLIKGALKHLSKISYSCVITTNFDKALEKTFEYDKKPFEGFMIGTQPDSTFIKDMIKGNRCLLKLHGNVGEEKSYIFTSSQYKKAYGPNIDFTKDLPRTLRQIFISHSLLFLGCSLEKDKTLELFKLVTDSGEFEIPEHFAILAAPSIKSEKTKKENYLRDLNIKVIWYPNGKHETVENLLELAVDASYNHINI